MLLLPIRRYFSPQTTTFPSNIRHYLTTLSPTLENVEALLARTQSEEESGTDDISEQQRILEEENIDAEENQSSAGTLTPDRGDKMEIDGSGPTTRTDAKRPVSIIPVTEKPGPSAGCSQLKGKSTLVDSAAAQAPAGSQGDRASGSASSTSESSSAPKNTGMPEGTGFKGSIYEAIRKLRNATTRPRLIGVHAETRHWSSNLGDLASEGGKLSNSAHYRHIYDSKVNISTSFNPLNLYCSSCHTGHFILERGEAASPVCFIASDQCFPACLPAMESGRCCAIIRVEDGSLSEIMTAARNILGNTKLPVGTVFLLSSASHLARAGTAKYAGDLVEAIKTMERDYGSSIRVAHGFPLFRSAVENKLLLRSILDIMDWLSDVDKRCLAHLEVPSAEYTRFFLLDDAHPSPAQQEKYAYQLPASVKKREVVNFLTGGHPSLKTRCPPCSDEMAADFIKILLCSLNAEFALHLDTAAGNLPLPEGGRDKPTVEEDVLIVVGGGSHAERLANALGNRHANIADLSLPGWKITEQSAEDLAGDIARIAKDNPVEKMVVILHLFDNQIFKGLVDDEPTDPVRIGGKYHITGKLAVVGAEEFKALFALALKIIRAAQQAKVILISPMYRYVTGRCCRDDSHISNFEEPEFTKRLGNSMQALGKQLRSLVWHRHWKNVQVINPAAHMGIGTPNSLSSEEADLQLASLLQMWGKDPVHPTAAAYDQLAETLLVKAAALTEKPEQLVLPQATGTSQKRKRSPSRDNRPSWLRGSVSEVGRRVGGSDAHGPGSGHHDWRGYDARNRGHDSRRGNAGWKWHRGARGGQGGNAAPWSGPQRRY